MEKILNSKLVTILVSLIIVTLAISAMRSATSIIVSIPAWLTAPVAIATGLLTALYAGWAVGWLTDAHLRAIGADRVIGWIARGSTKSAGGQAVSQPVQQPGQAQQQAAAAPAPVEAPAVVRSAKAVDAAQLVERMADRVRGQDALLERLAGDVAVRLGRPPRSISQPVMSGLVVGPLGKSLVAGELAKALGWPVITADAGAGEIRTLVLRIEAGPAVVVFELDDADLAAKATFLKLAAGELAVSGKAVAANQVIVLGLIREEPADVKIRHSVDAVFAIEPLGTLAKVEAVLVGLADAEDQAGVRIQLRDRDVAELARMDLREARAQMRGVSSTAAARKLDEAFVEMAAGKLVLAEL